jgi:cytochrome oxidase Cu insertion factor (SCO1/SenC/PrrC family)
MKWLLLAGVFGAALLAGTLALALDGDRQSIGSGSDHGPYRGSEPPARFELPGFSWRNYDGREVDATELRGRVVVLTFLDSQCTDVCPILASQIGGRSTA